MNLFLQRLIRKKTISDKELEKKRYDNFALNISNKQNQKFGSLAEEPILREPYIYYESLIKKEIKSQMKVLELGSGTGRYTKILLENSNLVYATDISIQSLKFIKEMKNINNQKLQTFVCDIEKLPFDDKTFDIITSAGVLSYGNNNLVLNEIYRLLKPNGKFICVDSLNNNPIYFFNRLIHVLRGNRSISTIIRMPSLKLLKKFKMRFRKYKVRFFGKISWFSLIASYFLEESFIIKLSSIFDNKFNLKFLAFKFVLIVTK